MSTIRLEFLKSLFPYKKGQIVDFRASKYSDLVKKYTRIVTEDESNDTGSTKELTKKEILENVLKLAEEKEMDLELIKKETRSLNKADLELYLSDLKEKDVIIDSTIVEDDKTPEIKEKAVKKSKNKAILSNKNTK